MEELKLKVVDEAHEVTHKTCTKCKIEKPLAEFPQRNDSGAKVARGLCHKCTADNFSDYRNKNRKKINAHALKYAKSNKHKQRAGHLKRKFGITVEDFALMSLNQNNSCAICLKHESTFKQGLCVDHCHKTSKIRGLLCINCNFLLGYSSDSEEVLNSALKYIKRFK